MNRTDYRIAWALLGILTALYWFTFGGHTYSPDEEMLYYVTEGIVERGSFTVPVRTETSSLSTGARGVDGNNYAITGILQSLLAIPLYLAGRLVAGGFAPWFRPYWTRFFVCLLNGLVGGGTASLMYLTGRKLGYKRRTALFLALGLGLTTFVGVYARTFFSESLVTFWLLLGVLASYSYRASPQAKWGLLLGLALGLSIATKPQSVIAVPVFIFYLLVMSFRDLPAWKARASWLGKTTLWCVIGGLLPMLLVFAYNYARFRNPLETGYTAVRSASSFRGVPAEAIYGFLFSSGKSLFLYAPLAILGVAGTRALSKRHRLETGLLWLLSASRLLFYAFFKRGWWGGGAWGPRYLTCIVPLMLLPAGSFLESQKRSHGFHPFVACLLFVTGLLVQTGAVLTNFNTYYNLDFGEYHSLGTVGWDSLLFQPEYSPVTGHWDFWWARYEKWRAYRQTLAEHGDGYVCSGYLHDTEVPDMAPYGAWTSGAVTLKIYTLPRESLDVSITYWRPSDEEGVPQDKLAFSVDGKRLESSSATLDGGMSGRHEDRVSADSDQFAEFPPTVVFTSTLWSPFEVGMSGDRRRLGIFVEDISVKVDGREIQLAGLERSFYQLPVSASRSWNAYATSWFWRSDLPHLVDCWWWYVTVVGFLPRQVRCVQVVGIGVIVTVAGLSLYVLTREMYRLVRGRDTRFIGL